MSILRDITVRSQKYLDSEEILLFIGARQAGKTTVLKQIMERLKNQKAKSYFLNLEDPEYLDLLNKNPKNLFKILPLDLKKRNFVFIDEVQYLSNPSNFLKYIFDEHKQNIKLIVSGSSAFYIDKKFRDSLAGRKKIFNVFTVSFNEFLRFKKEDELSKKNFYEISLEEKNKIGLFYREYLVFGGYPRVVLSPLDEKEEVLKEIAYSYIKKDIYEANVRQDEVFYKLFKILANQAGNLVNSSELANTLGVSKTAIDNYLYIMQKSFHINLIKPFFGNVRKELTKMPKVFFLDTGLRNFFAGSFDPFETRKDRGMLLENAVFRQLLEKYNHEDIKFWRTIAHNEVDFVINGELALEVKADVQKLKTKNYRVFLDRYPDIKFTLVSFEPNIDSINSYPVIDVRSV